MNTETDKHYGAVVGTFDGVHTGHAYLLKYLRSESLKRSLGTRVYTFNTHPLATIAPSRCPAMLTSTCEKEQLLCATGVDSVIIMDFDNISTLTAREFMEKIYLDGVRMLVIGHDNRFGSDGLKTLEEFKDAATGIDIEIIQAPELTTPDGEDINSSMIRELIACGQTERANRLSGHNFTIAGTVVHGKQLGRTIGFPTANLYPDPAERKVIPAQGVYACTCTVNGVRYRAMVNIGSRPTVDGPCAATSIEAHIIGFTGDIYGRRLELEFATRLRDEQRFGSLDELRARLDLDLEATVKSIKI